MISHIQRNKPTKHKSTSENCDPCPPCLGRWLTCWYSQWPMCSTWCGQPMSVPSSKLWFLWFWWVLLCWSNLSWCVRKWVYVCCGRCSWSSSVLTCWLSSTWSWLSRSESVSITMLSRGSSSRTSNLTSTLTSSWKESSTCWWLCCAVWSWTGKRRRGESFTSFCWTLSCRL